MKIPAPGPGQQRSYFASLVQCAYGFFAGGAARARPWSRRLKACQSRYAARSQTIAMAEYGYTDLDVQYSPRFWVPRMHEKLVVDNHMEITRAESNRVRETVPYSSVRYGDGPRETMDVFGGEKIPKDAPIFVYIHGGYWQHLSKEISCYPVKPLFDAGIRVVVVGYDLAPNVNMTKIVEEAKRAGSHIMEMAKQSGSRGVWFSGFSAGGHLAGILLASEWMDELPAGQSELILGFLPISGIFDLQPLVKTYINEPLKMDEFEAEKNSPLHMNIKNRSKVKVVAIFGQHDSPAFQAQSRDFVKKLQSEKIAAELYEVPHQDHFNVVEDLKDPQYILTKKLISIMMLEYQTEM